MEATAAQRGAEGMHVASTSTPGQGGHTWEGVDVEATVAAVAAEQRGREGVHGRAKMWR